MEVKKEYHIELLTPCFCHGANRRHPELRVPSIRGQIRQWRCLRGGREASAMPLCWGDIKKDGQPLASKVSLELSHSSFSHHRKEPLLPHRPPKKEVLSEAIPSGVTLTLTIRRLVGCTDEIWQTAIRDVETWLLFGCLGQRANRAAGSVWCKDWDLGDDLQPVLSSLQIPESWDIRLASVASPEEGRRIASDTVKRKDLFGTIKPRQPSPVKMKVVKLRSGYHLLLVGIGVSLDDALNALTDRPKYPQNPWKKLKFRKICLSNLY
ncbi:MAG: hypothetical protein D6820_15615 [Lentisphaerae bacterium]|nr:MAG: hypothetical protein D6820_15615 [Lentisphaerota bacterium]